MNEFKYDTRKIVNRQSNKMNICIDDFFPWKKKETKWRLLPIEAADDYEIVIDLYEEVSENLLDNIFFFSSRGRHTSWTGDWSSDVCSSDLAQRLPRHPRGVHGL